MSPNHPSGVYELRFWLQILGDHARFIKYSLEPDQTNISMIAANFIELLDRLLEKTRESKITKEPIMKSHLGEILQTTLSFRDFKRELLAERLKNKLVTALPPVFYNHMLNELECFLKVLTDIECGQEKEENILGQHLLWSLDAAAHAAIIASDLDKVEYRLREMSIKFETAFDHDYIKAVELAGYFRSSPPSAAPVLEAYNRDMAFQMKEFMAFLEELKVGLKEQRISGRLWPLAVDHMYREECYYLSKIAAIEPNLSIPDCDPGRPRVES